MQQFGFPLRVRPGRDAREVPALFDGRDDEYLESRRRLGIRLERLYAGPGLAGDLAIAYFEADRDYLTTMAALATSDLGIDREYVERLRAVHGFDLARPLESPAPELLGEWLDPAITKHHNGLAFTAGLRPGMTPAARAFAVDAFGHRRYENTLSRRALGITAERLFLNVMPDGDMVTFYWEGDDPADSARHLAASESVHDTWFKEECRRLFVDEFDLAQPLPQIDTLWDRELSKVPV